MLSAVGWCRYVVYAVAYDAPFRGVGGEIEGLSIVCAVHYGVYLLYDMSPQRAVGLVEYDIPVSVGLVCYACCHAHGSVRVHGACVCRHDEYVGISVGPYHAVLVDGEHGVEPVSVCYAGNLCRPCYVVSYNGQHVMCIVTMPGQASCLPPFSRHSRLMLSARPRRRCLFLPRRTLCRGRQRRV